MGRPGIIKCVLGTLGSASAFLPLRKSFFCASVCLSKVNMTQQRSFENSGGQFAGVSVNGAE